MTEDQAFATRCCGPIGTGELQGVFRMCITSRCMGWRETKPGVPATKDENNNPIKPVYAHGYCGLSGPEPK
jgi:hypothetical protein